VTVARGKIGYFVDDKYSFTLYLLLTLTTSVPEERKGHTYLFFSSAIATPKHP